MQVWFVYMGKPYYRGGKLKQSKWINCIGAAVLKKMKRVRKFILNRKLEVN